MADHEARSNDSGVNWVLVIAVLALLLLVAWFFWAGQNRNPERLEMDVEVPQAEAPSVEVPEQIDVNVRQEGGGR